jgi:hypothetical protein
VFRASSLPGMILARHDPREIVPRIMTNSVDGGELAHFGAAARWCGPEPKIQLKAQQSAKIRQLRETLLDAGIGKLSEQATALGLCRSTAWTILQGNHKNSGLTADVVNKILAAPHAPEALRAKVLEYVREKASGRYGHTLVQRRKFVARLATVQVHEFCPAETIRRRSKTVGVGG